MTSTARPRDPADLAVLVPYQLGYHPGPSVILTVMRGRRLGLLQRHDLHADPTDCAAVAQRALQIVRREDATAVLLLAYEDTAGESAPLRAAMVAAAGESGVPVQEHLLVRDGRWFAPDCHEACCPDEGHDLPSAVDVPAVAAFVHAGVAPLPSRQSLVENVLPPRDEARARAVGRRLEALGRDTNRQECIDAVVHGWTRVLDPRAGASALSTMGDDELALVTASLADVTWRDALMTVLCPGVMPTTQQESPAIDPALRAAVHCPWVDGRQGSRGQGSHGRRVEQVGGHEDHHELALTVRGRLVELIRLVPAAVSPPVLTLVAHLAWWAGDGTVTGVCLEQALRIDPHYRLADLMLQLLTAGVRPWSDSDAGADAPAGGDDPGWRGSAA